MLRKFCLSIRANVALNWRVPFKILNEFCSEFWATDAQVSDKNRIENYKQILLSIQSAKHFEQILLRILSEAVLCRYSAYDFREYCSGFWLKSVHHLKRILVRITSKSGSGFKANFVQKKRIWQRISNKSFSEFGAISALNSKQALLNSVNQNCSRIPLKLSRKFYSSLWVISLCNTSSSEV